MEMGVAMETRVVLSSPVMSQAEYCKSVVKNTLFLNKFFSCQLCSHFFLQEKAWRDRTDIVFYINIIKTKINVVEKHSIHAAPICRSTCLLSACFLYASSVCMSSICMSSFNTIKGLGCGGCV